MQHKWSQVRLISLMVVAFIVASTANASGRQPVMKTYYDLIYDFEVAQFCGLVSKRVHDAFWAKRKAAEAESSLSEEKLRHTRIRAMAAAELEYANRGLGGYKPWCQREGRSGIERILIPQKTPR